jgi:anti-sigma B factor antagonist
VHIRVEREDAGSLPVVTVHGELDLETAPELRRALIEAIDDHPGSPLVVDLEGVDFIDSAGLGVLVGGLKRARDRGGDVLLVATGQNVVRVLELTGLTRAFEIHPSRAAALSAGPGRGGRGRPASGGSCVPPVDG